MAITQEQIDKVLSGIEDGITIKQCCKYILNMSSSEFYKSATQEQKDLVKIYKTLQANLSADYNRAFMRNTKKG
jgi:hypothetical protein